VRPGKASGRVTPEGETARTPNFLLGSTEIGREAILSKPARQCNSFTVAYAPVKCRDRVPKPKPWTQPEPKAAPPNDPFIIGRIESWQILAHTDTLGRRVLARCVHCKAVREISVANDFVACCGCSRGRTLGGGDD
jgi:hypothetical protein